MTTFSDVAFQFSFQGFNLVADPFERESLCDAMIRAIESGVGQAVQSCSSCRRIAPFTYGYSITLADGQHGVALIKPSATLKPAPCGQLQISH
jgi:hypothetical protein